MRRRLTNLAFMVPLVFAACASPAVEISITTRTEPYEGRIFIGGEVNNPGLYSFSADDRLAELIRAAGGLKEGADTSQVELSFGAQDIPQKIDINRADAWLLEALPEIGAVTAQNIIIFREANGPFRSTSELLKIPGIGAATLSKIEGYVTVGGT